MYSSIFFISQLTFSIEIDTTFVKLAINGTNFITKKEGV